MFLFTAIKSLHRDRALCIFDWIVFMSEKMFQNPVEYANVYYTVAMQRFFAVSQYFQAG